MDQAALCYSVVLNGTVIGKFQYFHEAWCHVFLDLRMPVFCIISGPEGYWKVISYYLN